MKKFNISKEFLIEEYINKEKTGKEVARIVGCHYKTIKRYLKKYNIKKELGTKNIPKEILIEEYVNNRKTIKEIARIIGCHSKTIKTYLKKYNIKILSRKEQTIKFIKKQFAKEGYTLISTKYINNEQKLEHICPVGHHDFITWMHWRKGSRCNQCSQENRRIKHKIIKGIEHKRCSKCKKWKLLNNFYKDASNWDNFASICKKCGKLPNALRRDKRRAIKLNAMPEDANQKEILFYKFVCVETNEILGEIYFNVDHIQPFAKGGQHHEDNLQILEATLNRQKNARWPLTPEEQIKYKGFRL